MSPPSSGSKSKLNKKAARARALLATGFMLVSCLAYSSTLKMEAVCSSETSADFQRTTLNHIPVDKILHNHRCENLKSYTNKEINNFVCYHAGEDNEGTDKGRSWPMLSCQSESKFCSEV
jgi:hypothetical protein